MAKHLKVILENKRLEGVKKSTVEPSSTGVEPGVDYKPKAPDDQEFVSIHKTEKHASRAGNGADVFAGAKQKPALSDPKNKHLGYKDLKASMKVNEAATCNESPAATKCPMHGLNDCSGYTGKNKHLLLDKKVAEAVEKVDEVLTAKDPASKWIHDFVHSDNPKFVGKSKEKRKEQALAAFYDKKRSVKEDAAEPMLEGGKKKKTQKESGPDSQTMPAKTDSGVADDAGRIL